MNKHVEAVAVWEMYRDNKAKDQTVLSQLSMAHADAQRVTREWIKFLSRTLRYCASQEIALRAHRDLQGGCFSRIASLTRTARPRNQDTSEC